MTETATAVQWNPTVERGTTIRVFEYYNGVHFHIEPEPGYHLRTAAGTSPDSDGDILLSDVRANGGMYAKRWTLDVDMATEDVLKVGDWIKVTGVLLGAHPDYRAAMMGTVRKVASIELQGVRVEVTPEEMVTLNLSGPAFVSGHEKAEDPNAVEWNPLVTPGTLVWVYEYAGGGGNLDLREDTYHQRIVGWGGNSDNGTAIGVRDDGTLLLRPAQGLPELPGRASKWRRPDAGGDLWNPAVPAGTKVKVYEYSSSSFEPMNTHFDHRGSYDLREATYGHIDQDGDIRVNPEEGLATWSYAKRWMLADKPEVQPVTGQSEPDWAVLISNLRETMDEHANDPESGDKWCSEYEEVLQNLFGWSSERNHRVAYEVKVRLSRTVDADDVVNASAVFSGYGDDADIEPDSISIDGIVRVNVDGSAEDGPERDEVEESLDAAGYQYDSFDILDHEPID